MADNTTQSPAPRTAVLGVVPMAMIGCAAGIAEVTCNQPLIYCKNCIQTGTPINFNPKFMYRGYGVNVGSVAPITAFQVAASGAIYHALFASGKIDQGAPPTPLELGVSALLAGGLSGTLSGPSETIILQQQQTGVGAGATFKDMYARAGLKGLFRGTQFAMGREAIYTAGYMALGPLFMDKARESGLPDVTARLVGGIIAGITAAVLSHPFDTLKTFYQNDFEHKQLPNFRAAVNHGSLFKGLVPRMGRLVVGTVVISNINDVLTRQYVQYQSEKPQVV